ncbi:ABC transporter permease [Bacteroidales bacterium OttesenSCG-928-B11]|nr:ABC transporter permease [Bacteroidales bacterium OttesenSCG-928-E04]MDL2308451.1 ABC transporter permease [Bacteroidales bacterium OttesenSCG-928-C03]MDL2311316.1 ABC transporter permease [Bacteroidales bacterium OttesenSCG-928-B11]MDL2326042.1 ABC transporter permease [Bacteroidales bacterium OttesenSCG-928-A14]
MLDLDSFKEVWQAITRNKTRSVLTAFGVFWGIFMYVVMTGLGNGFENGLMRMVDQISPNAVFFFPNATSVEYKGFNSGRFWSMNNDDMHMVKENIPAVEYVSGMMFMYPSNPTTYKERSGEYSINGIDNYYQEINPMPLLFGRFFNDFDMLEQRKMCIIGVTVWQTLFENGMDPVGERLNVDGVFYTVVGVVNPGDAINLGGDAKEAIYIPSSTFQQVYNYGKNIDALMVAAYDKADINQVENEIKELLKNKHFIAPEDNIAISHFNVQQIFLMFNYLFLGLNILIWIVGMGTMLAGVVGVSNIMLVTIKERTQEIGIKRAIGAKPRAILMQVMSESTVLTFIAGFFGLFFGVLILTIVDKLVTDAEMFYNPYISFNMAVLAAVIILLSGAVAGIIPARNAVRIKAIDALRDE